MSSDTRSLIEVLSWLNTGFHTLLVLAFIVICFVNAKRIGMAGATLLVVVAFLDVAQVCTFRVGMIAMRTAGGYGAMDSFFTAMGVLNVLSSLVAAGLVVAAMALLRKRPTP